MKKISLLTWLGAIMFSIVLVGTSCGAAKQVATTPQMVDGSYAAKEKALLWQISGNKLKKPSYLFGTIHMIPKDDFFMPDYVKTAFDASKNVVFEINMDDMSDMSMMGSIMNMMFMDDGMTLKDLFSEEDYKRIKAKLDENPMMSMMGGMVDKMKPFFVSMMMEQSEMGIDPMGGGVGATPGIESYELVFTDMAKAADKPMDGLETVEFQMSMFDSISLEEQADMLLKSLDADPEEGEDMTAKMVEMYKDLDVPGLFTFIQEQSGGEGTNFEDMLLTLRNENWIPIMAEKMKSDVHFFAVGAGHLGGEKGVIALLRKEGYILTPINK